MDNTRYYNRTIRKESVPCPYAGSPRTVRVLLPPGYNELVTYPAVYCQDGDDFFQFGRIATAAMRLTLDEGVEPFLVIGIDVDRTRRTSEYLPGGSRNEAYVSFVAEELLPYVEDRYPVRKEERIAAGDSLGAAVSLQLSLTYPAIFRRVLSLSGAFFEEVQQLVRNENDLQWLEVHALVGLEETAVTTDRGTFDFVEGNRTTMELLSERGARLSYRENSGGHTWGFWQQELPAMLKEMLR